MRQLLAVIFALTAVSLFPVNAVAQSDPPLLLRFPTVSKTQIVFNYAGDLWIVSRDGGDATRLTSGIGTETVPAFSPDGSMIAFTGEYDGNLDVYVVPVSGGVPRRLTYHPADEIVLGWTPDGKKILFASWGNSFMHFENQLYTVPVEGGFPTQLPISIAWQASYSPDAAHLAYVPHIQWQAAWKRYHGGQTTPIWIADLKDSSITKVPRDNSNDHSPMWIGDTVYFLSDRNGPVSLFAYDTKTKQVSEALHSDGLDFKNASAGLDAIVVEQFGAIKLFDLNTHQAKNIHIRVAGDIAAVRPHFTKVEPKRIQNFGISPTGVRAVFEAWGEIFTVPTDKGDIRNLTHSPAVADRDPAWSPDGKSIAYFSDESGEYELTIRDQNGMGQPRHINLGNPPSFFYGPTWSPDSKKIAYTDKRMNFWYVGLEKGTPVRVDADRFEDPSVSLAASWSPDSKWLTYSKFLENHLRGIFVYSLESGKVSQITDGLGDARYPVFDKGGKELIFAASTDLGLSSGWLDLSSFQHPVLRHIYAAVLKKGEKSPVEPQSDEEKSEEKKEAAGDKGKEADKAKEGEKGKEGEKKDEKKEEAVKVTIDLDGIGQRIVALPIKAANYVTVDTGKAGTLFLSEIPDVPRFEPDVSRLEANTPQTVTKFDMTTRKTEPFLAGINGFGVSANGEKVLYRQGPGWFIAKTDAAPKPGEGALNIGAMEVFVDPRVEWNQMYREVWRIQRDFLYDPNHHGLNIPATEKKYAAYLKGVGGRSDLNYLFDEMLGEVTIGHMFIFGGDIPEAKKVKGGLLGADYKIENGRYRFARIFNGENWNPDLRAPLTQPGVDVKPGEYLLEVNGVDVRPPADVSRFLENTADTQVRIKVGPNPDGKDAREVTVVPVASEFPLRNRAWEEDNRRKVDEMSGGKIAYVHVPDTAVGGYLNFNRFYFAQVGKQAAVIDERYNHGGAIADYIIDELERPLRNCAITREGEKFCSPLAQIYGPKTMIINEMSGSGGDALPWMFKQDKVGPLVGTRTWGGLVGIWNYPPLMDGGFVTAPRGAIYGLHGDWEVENHGIAPDIEIENDPASVAAGHDAQLEKAVQVTLEALKKNPVVLPDHPPYPNYHKK